MEEATIQLGNKIELSGFSDIDRQSMTILKKIIGNYVNKMEAASKNFEKLYLRLKKIHDKKFEIHAKLMDNGQAITAESTDFNLFVCTDAVLKKILNSFQ
ncbi:hypothetical protein KY307_01330 [Candidatus Woesearchaeota archaeon]|nr:hypothetical protein [Candidatus Woesearchaeota archaeon]